MLALTLTVALLAPQDPDAAAIHRAALTVDTHKDIDPLLAAEPPSDPELAERFRRAYDPSVDGDQQVDFPKMRAGGLDCAFFIVYVGQGRNDAAGFAAAKKAALAKFDAIDRMCERFPETIELARSADDVERIAKAGKLVACIGIENGYPMGEDLGLIEVFHQRGARYMSICHNRHNQLGDSHTPADSSPNGGLSDLGRKAIAAMNRVGIMVDVSHAAKPTMLQAVAASEAPVIASHSGCRAVCDHSRNLDDEQLRALAANGGVVQCVALGAFVKDEGPRDAAIAKLREELELPREREWAEALAAAGDEASDLRRRMELFNERVLAFPEELQPADVSDFVDHVDHAIQVCGIDHVGIASDFDGGGGIEGWRNARETIHVTEELLRRGYDKEQIGKIWSGNTLRVLRAVEAHAAASR